LLAALLGLAFGYLDLGGYVLKKDILHGSAYYQRPRFFPWAVPLAYLAILMVPGLAIAGLNRIRSDLVSLRIAAWTLATIGLWGALLNFPLATWASLLFAAGVGRWIGPLVALVAPRCARWGRFGLLGLMGVLIVTAAATTGRQLLAELRRAYQLPAPPRAGAPNVLFVVLDTVRAANLSLHGYTRDTTPRLNEWTRRGVHFEWAMAPSCWTYPSHCSFFTGYWPRELNSHWQYVLDTSKPTLAEFLTARGYRTAGFVANTRFCSYESGLDRGFGHYEDYPLSPQTILGTTSLGRWLSKYVYYFSDFYNRKWVQYQSRDARGINRAFLDWLSHQPSDKRPFFAFLNYLDAHGPFVAPSDHAPRFGTRPTSRRDYEMLLDFWDLDKSQVSPRDVVMARDGYDDCISFLDGQLGALLGELDRRGVLSDTLVIITSDHGEEFAEHGLFDHGHSLYLNEVHVPLVFLLPAGPHGRAVTSPVSLRDLPATIVDLLGFGGESPFPGQTLAAHWRDSAAASSTASASTTPAISEADFQAIGLNVCAGTGPFQWGFTMSQVSSGWHYVRDATGAEGLYNLVADPTESRNLAKSPDSSRAVIAFRQSLLDALAGMPRADRPEPEYLKRFRNRLKAVTPDQRGPPAAPAELSAVQVRSAVKPPLRN
jgi:arylsulfatase A-like enzyme